MFKKWSDGLLESNDLIQLLLLNEDDLRIDKNLLC